MLRSSTKQYPPQNKMVNKCSQKLTRVQENEIKNKQKYVNEFLRKIKNIYNTQ